MQNLPVVFAIDRGGLVGADGATHMRAVRFFLSALHPQYDGDGAHRRERVPSDALHRLRARAPLSGALSARLRHGCGDWRAAETVAVGRGEIRREGRGVAILAFGSMLTPALLRPRTRCHRRQYAFRQAAGRRNDERACATHELLVTVEENAVMGGAGSAVARACGQGVTGCCFIWVCRTASSNRATPRNCWLGAGWTKTAWSVPCASSQRSYTCSVVC